jgi:hypothetical protein
MRAARGSRSARHDAGRTGRLRSGDGNDRARLRPGGRRANCGIGFTADGNRAIANWSGVFGADIVDGEGEWYVFDTGRSPPQHGVLRRGGRARCPNHARRTRVLAGEPWHGRRTAHRCAHLRRARPIDAGDTPDILDFSPDGRFAYVTQRGPNPLSGDPHVARGTLPGVLVIDVRTGEHVLRLDPTTVRDADGACSTTCMASACVRPPVASGSSSRHRRPSSPPRSCRSQTRSVATCPRDQRPSRPSTRAARRSTRSAVTGRVRSPTARRSPR